jgi:hypothetical protein
MPSVNQVLLEKDAVPQKPKQARSVVVAVNNDLVHLKTI